VVAEESQPSWFQDAPKIRGSVTLSNPSQYNVPIDNIIVQARSSDGMQYSTTASCDGGSSTTVPYNPVTYTYGTATCRYRILLDRRVFGSYGQSGNRRRLQGSGAVQANFFPSSSGGGNSGGSGSSSGGYGYFPPPSSRPTWTVTAIATIRFSNAQCLSAPTTVNTDCWWSWLVSWHQQHHHKGWWWSGRRLSMAATAPSQGQTVEKPSEVSDTLPARQLSGEHHHKPHHGHHMHTQQHGSIVSRSLLNANNQHGGGFGFVVSGGSGHHAGVVSLRGDRQQDARGGSVSSIDDADSVDAAVDNIASKADA
jgi:hypothetical protein